MSKVIGIIGIPGTGKTTLMRQWMAKREWTKDTPVKLLDGYVSGDIRLFGKYEDGEVFAGTDKLSMAVQPMAVEYMGNEPSPVVVFEGDRLTSSKFFEAVKRAGHDLSIIVLKTDDAIRQQRYADRGSDQSETFINGRVTKVANIEDMFGEKILMGEAGCVHTFAHNVPEDTQQIIDFIEKSIAS